MEEREGGLLDLRERRGRSELYARVSSMISR